MVIFRENTEDIYAGIEFAEGTPEVEQLKQLLEGAFPKPYGKIRFPDSVGLGIKPVSREGTERLVRAAIEYAVANKRKSLTLVHKGNIMKFTEGAFRDWGYELAKREFGAVEFDGGPWCKLPNGLVDQGRHRRRVPAADPDAPGRVRRHRHAEPQWRLHLRRAGRAGRRHRHRAGRQHQLRHRPRRLRGHARHRAEVRQPGQGEPGFGHPLGRDDVPVTWAGRRPRT